MEGQADDKLDDDGGKAAAPAAAPIPALGELGLNRFAPYLMNRIMWRWNATMQEALRGYDLTTPKMRTLAVLSVLPGLTINDLSVYAVIEVSTMSRTLDALENDGLVRRVAGETDGRVRKIYLTEEGQSAFMTFWPEMHSDFRYMFKGISADEEEAFLGTLQKILKNIRRHDL